MNNSGELDLGPLTWVKGEIDLALGRAGDALKQHGDAVASATDAASLDPALLKSAQTHLHQAHGALAIVGLGGVTLFTEAIEQAIVAAISDQSVFTVQTESLCRRAMATVSTYLDELLEGAPDQPLRLLPVYRELMVLRGVPAASVTPSDLFFPDLSRRPPRREKEPAALPPEVLTTRLKAARLGFQRGMLKWLKGDDKGIKEMRNSLAVIEFTQIQPATRAFWWSAMAFLDALAAGGLVVDPVIKKLCARMDAQIAKLLEGSTEVAERLERDVLYYVAIASSSNDHVECVRAAYRLHDLLPAAAPMGDPEDERASHLARVRALRETLELAKDAWSAYSSSGQASVQAGGAQFQALARQLAEQAQALGQMDLARLTAGISAVAQMLSAQTLNDTRLADAFALEVATSLLLIENGLERFDRLGVDFAHQVDVMTSRLTALLRGEAPDALQAMEVPHLDEISRKAQEHLMMDQLVGEITSLLGGVEQKLDAYFRDPAGKGHELDGLQGPLKQIEGALNILNETRAVDVLRECEQVIAGFAQPGYLPVHSAFEDVANKLSALGFFAEKLRHGPASLDALLNPRALISPVEPAVETEAELEPEVLQVQALPFPESPVVPSVESVPAITWEVRMPDAAPTLEEADSPPELPEGEAYGIAGTDTAAMSEGPASVVDHEQWAEALGKTDEAPVVELPSLVPPSAAPSAEAVRLVDASSESIDAELLGIFLEEAREVLQTIREHLPRLDEQPHDHETLTVIRRAFHTIKGSGRMVGLTDLGEIAWSVEQVMNDRLKLDQGATPALRHMLSEAQILFSDWVHCLEATQTPPNATSAAVVALHALCVRLMQGEEPEVAPAGQIATPEILPVAPAAIAEADADVSGAWVDQPPEGVDTSIPEVGIPEAGISEAVQISPIKLPRDGDPVIIGPLSISRMVYDIYIDEAMSHMMVLETEQPALRVAAASPEALRAAHTLGGVSGTLGLKPINRMGKSLEYALERFAAAAVLPDDAQYEVLVQTVTCLRHMLEAVAQCRMPVLDESLVCALDALVPQVTGPAEPPAIPEDLPPPQAVSGAGVRDALPDIVSPPCDGDDQRRKLRIHDDIDPQLLPIFLEEGEDLMHEIGVDLRAWRATPADAQIPLRLQRLLHTLKGSARMAGAMRMGETVHGIETHIIEATRRGALPEPGFLDRLDDFYDRTLTLYEALVRGDAAVDEATQTAAPVEQDASTTPGLIRTPEPDLTVDAGEASQPAETGMPRAQLRVRAELVDQFINDVGEMTIARSRIEGEMRTVKSALLDLTENVIRLRQQLREIEIQAESQMQSQMAQLQEAHQGFDPLEMDRFTRFQELTRMMAESVNDVTTVQHNLLRNVDNATTALAAQARINRELSQSLMGVRMVPFNSIIDRLYRVVRQGAKELGKRVNLDVRGGQIEIDRSVLEKMVGPIEHLLRNSIAHGIEDREVRRAAGKMDIGEISIDLTQQGNEIVIELSDDGGGLDYDRIRAKAVEQGLISASHWVNESRLMEFIFESGFSTASEVSEISGRGVGMDVVKTEATKLGGHVEVQSQTGQGTSFRIFLPLTLSVVQAVLVRSGSRIIALPSSMVEQVMELKPEAVETIRTAGGTDWLGTHYPWCYLPRLLEESEGMPPAARRHWILLLKGADRRIALEVDGLLGNQEVVVKNIGPQLAHVQGVTGATVLNDGQIALILNPVTLFSRAAKLASEGMAWSSVTGVSAALATDAVAVIPTIMVVDDSLTVRKIVSRLLTREGYQVVTAKDGVDALEQLLDIVPAAMLVDIEMPRMDGFELTRNVRAQERLKHIPVIMITSRIADKHRNYAQEIGVNEYLGKPYDEEVLLGKLCEFVEQQGMVVPKAI